MRRTSVDRSFRLRAGVFLVPILTLAAVWPTAARSQVTETVSIENQYGYGVGSAVPPASVLGGSTETFYVGSPVPGIRSEVGLNYTATADESGFFFLHDNYCVGTCATSSQTIINFTITNNGDGPVDLRFDSQITPGHIAQIFGESAMSGSFDFAVTQSVGERSATLYSATGGVNSDGIYLSTGNLIFNGLTSTEDPDGRWEVLDWGATNLSIPLLTLFGGETSTLTYTATYNTFATAACEDVTNCQGLQVVFGDPRNNGGVTLSALAFDAEVFNAEVDLPYPVIGRDYDPYFVMSQIVPLDAPLPGDPAALEPTNYGPLFNPRATAVPEPATWAMMVGGFGIIGAGLRRRRRPPLVAC